MIPEKKTIKMSIWLLRIYFYPKNKRHQKYYLGLESRLHLRSILRLCYHHKGRRRNEQWLVAYFHYSSECSTDWSESGSLSSNTYQGLSASTLNYHTFLFLLCCRIKRGIQSVSQRLKDFKFFVTDYIIQAKLTETILRYILTIIIISIINTMIHFTTAIIINIGIIRICSVAPVNSKPYIVCRSHPFVKSKATLFRLTLPSLLVLPFLYIQ